MMIIIIINEFYKINNYQSKRYSPIGRLRLLIIIITSEFYKFNKTTV